MERHFALGRLLDIYGALLTKRQRELLSLSVNEDYSLAEIAEREGITRQGVRDALKRAEEQLWDMEQKLSLLKISDGLRELQSAMQAQAKNDELMGKIEELIELSGG